MITKTQNANGLWWRLLATLSVLALLLMVNTNAMAQNKKAANDKVLEKAEVMPQFPLMDSSSILRTRCISICSSSRKISASERWFSRNRNNRSINQINT